LNIPKQASTSTVPAMPFGSKLAMRQRLLILNSRGKSWSRWVDGNGQAVGGFSLWRPRKIGAGANLSTPGLNSARRTYAN